MNILITGAGRGIGFETVIRFLQEKDNKVVALSRNLLKLKSKFKSEKPPSELILCEFDLTNKDYSPIVDIADKIGKIDILINNAGYLVNKKFEELDNTQWQTHFEVNVFAPARLIRVLLPFFRDGSHIVNVSSMGGFQGSEKFPGLSAYSSSKAAICNLTECLAEEFKERCISVNCLAIGSVNTDMLNEAFPDYQAPVDSGEMADFFYEFARNGHKYINGKIIPVSLLVP